MSPTSTPVRHRAPIQLAGRITRRPVQRSASAGARPQTRHDQLQEMLEQQRDFRLEQLAQLRRREDAHPARGVDREITESLIAGARSALRDVLEALERMAGGRYGACVECGRPVESDRLEVLPQTARCLACEPARVRAGA